MKLTLVTIDGKTGAEVHDGKPVYASRQQRCAFDAPTMVATISPLNGEAKCHRQAKE